MNLSEIKDKQRKAYEIIDGAWEEGSHEALADGYQKAFGLIDEALNSSIDAVEIVDLYKEWQEIEKEIWEMDDPEIDEDDIRDGYHEEELTEWKELVEKRDIAREAFRSAVEGQ